MNREESIALLARFELGKLSPEDRAAHVETALGEGLLEGQPALAGVANEAGNQAIDQVILDTLQRKC